MRFAKGALSIVLSFAFLGLPLPAGANESEISETGHSVDHVLLISVDGMHALDLDNYIHANPNSTLAHLSHRGVTYTNASTSRPSDSFPGLIALVTGGSPITTGIWYDVTYNHRLSPPGSNCGQIGTAVAFDESIDFDNTQLDGGASQHGGHAIDPSKLPLDPENSCTPVFPHQYLRVNTIFNVLHNHGRRTAWSDKHPAYDIVNGPSGDGVDDLFNPEIVANGDATKSLTHIMQYDSIKVQAILNEIDGFTHDRSRQVGVPAVFGMNFQAVSVGQKLAGNGYTDVLGTPSAGLRSELDFVDQSLGAIIQELKKQGIYDSTLIIVGAKHGQSPIDITKRTAIDDSLPAQLVGPSYAFDLSDDGNLIWLLPGQQDQVGNVVANLSTPANQNAMGIQEIFAGPSLRLAYNDPKVDPRTPDIIIKSNTGVIFTHGSKIAEHGGLNEDDVHAALLFSLPGLKEKQVKTQVTNQQVAPTILKLLGFNPNELQAVQAEQTRVLPFLFADEPDER